MIDQNKALVILSGGQDSTTCLFWAKAQKFAEIHALTFNYGQRHSREVEAAEIIAHMSNVTSHEVLELGDAILKGKSPLTNQDEKLETYKDYETMTNIIGERRELTFVPMRNPLFLTIAANRAEVLGCGTIIIGVSQADGANYSDCTFDFIFSMEGTINEALGYGDYSNKTMIQLVAPLIKYSKKETVELALTLPGCMDALAFSHTAYSGEYPPVTQDHATVLRAEGFRQAGVPDPLIVRACVEGLMEWPQGDNYTPTAFNRALKRDPRQ